MNMNSYKCCQLNTTESKRTTELLYLLKLLAEENRLKILCLLRQGELCVCEILEHFDLSQSLVSHHLITLKEALLVSDRKEGRQVFYSLTKRGQKIVTNIFAL